MNPPPILSQSTALTSGHHAANSLWLFYILYCICFHATLSIHPTLFFSHCVHKSVLYLCVFPAALQIGSSVSSVCCSVVKSCLAFATPWTEAHQASMALTISQSLPKLMSIELVMPSNHLILCHLFSFCLQSFPATESFQMSQFFALGGQSIRV